MIVRIAERRREADSVVRMILHVTAQHGHERTVESLVLTVCLRMIRGGEEIGHAQQGTDTLEEVRDELGAVVGTPESPVLRT